MFLFAHQASVQCGVHGLGNRPRFARSRRGGEGDRGPCSAGRSDSTRTQNHRYAHPSAHNSWKNIMSDGHSRRARTTVAAARIPRQLALVAWRDRRRRRRLLSSPVGALAPIISPGHPETCPSIEEVDHGRLADGWAPAGSCTCIWRAEELAAAPRRRRRRHRSIDAVSCRGARARVGRCASPSPLAQARAGAHMAVSLPGPGPIGPVCQRNRRLQ